MGIKAVLFDLDGIITDTAHYHFQAWKACANKFGIEIDESFNENLKGIDRSNSLKRILDYGGVELSHEDFEQVLNEKNECYLQLITGITRADILDGIEILIEDLERNNIKRIICSVSKNASAILKNLGIYEKFDVIVDPATIKKGKPSPDIFLEGARLAKVSIHECVAIEDAIAGIEAIKAARILAIGIGNESLDEANPDLRLSSTSQLSINVIYDLIGGRL